MTEQPGISPASVTKIREAREESQSEFAEQIGVSASTVGRWERGKMPPSGENIDAIRDSILKSLMGRMSSIPLN